MLQYKYNTSTSENTNTIFESIFKLQPAGYFQQTLLCRYGIAVVNNNSNSRFRVISLINDSNKDKVRFSDAYKSVDGTDGVNTVAIPIRIYGLNFSY